MLVPRNRNCQYLYSRIAWQHEFLCPARYVEAVLEQIAIDIKLVARLRVVAMGAPPRHLARFDVAWHQTPHVSVVREVLAHIRIPKAVVPLAHVAVPCLDLGFIAGVADSKCGG